MPAGRLEVNVLDGTRLKDTQTFGKQDPYCVLRVGEQRDRTKTCADGGTRPRWNERFRFSLAGHESALDLEVWNANKMTSDAYIGAALVSLGDVFASGTQDAAVPLRDKKNKIAGNVMLVLRFAPDVAENANRPGDAALEPSRGSHERTRGGSTRTTPPCCDGKPARAAGGCARVPTGGGGGGAGVRRVRRAGAFALAAVFAELESVRPASNGASNGISLPVRAARRRERRVVRGRADERGARRSSARRSSLVRAAERLRVRFDRRRRERRRWF